MTLRHPPNGFGIAPSYTLRDILKTHHSSKYQKRFDETQLERVRWRRKLTQISNTVKSDWRRNEVRRRRDKEERDKWKNWGKSMLQNVRRMKYWNPVVEVLVAIVIIRCSMDIVRVCLAAIIMAFDYDVVFCGQCIIAMVTQLTDWVIAADSVQYDPVSVFSTNRFLHYDHHHFPFANMANMSTVCCPETYRHIFGRWNSMEMKHFMAMHDLQSECEQQSCYTGSIVDYLTERRLQSVYFENVDVVALRQYLEHFGVGVDGQFVEWEYLAERAASVQMAIDVYLGKEWLLGDVSKM